MVPLKEQLENVMAIPVGCIAAVAVSLDWRGSDIGICSFVPSCCSRDKQLVGAIEFKNLGEQSGRLASR